MAEPAGILIEAHISESRLASFFRRQVTHGAEKARVGHVLSELLDQGGTGGDILIVNHEPESGTLFLAWVLDRYAPEAIAPMWPVLEVLAEQMDTTAAGKGVIASMLPECLETLAIHNRSLVRAPARLASPKDVAHLSERLWSFARDGRFPDPATSMQRRNFQCKALRSAWKSYLNWRDQKERPARIAAATEANPYRLVNDVFCWNGKVIDRDGYTGRDIPFPGADPLTFRMEAGFYADKNLVWQRRLAQNSPPAEIKGAIGTINNPAAIWEHHVLEGAVGAEFTWFDGRWDTLFWTDKRRIYALSKELGLVALPGVNAPEFRMCGQCFGTDGVSVFHGSCKLPLAVEELKTDGFFIWDGEKVFHADVELPLKGKAFKILGQKQIPGMVGKQFRLTDGNKTIVLGPGNRVLPDDPSF